MYRNHFPRCQSLPVHNPIDFTCRANALLHVPKCFSTVASTSLYAPNALCIIGIALQVTSRSRLHTLQTLPGRTRERLPKLRPCAALDPALRRADPHQVGPRRQTSGRVIPYATFIHRLQPSSTSLSCVRGQTRRDSRVVDSGFRAARIRTTRIVGAHDCMGPRRAESTR